jgi:hypothetical protein
LLEHPDMPLYWSVLPMSGPTGARPDLARLAGDVDHHAPLLAGDLAIGAGYRRGQRA